VTRLAIALATLAVAVAAAADMNPDIRIYLDVDPPYYVHEICPEEGTEFRVYICLDTLGPDGGTRGARFWCPMDFGGVRVGEMDLLGGLALGDVEDPWGGWMVVSGPDCVYPDEHGVVVVGSLTYLYTGPPGTLDIAPCGVEPRATIDCGFLYDWFCVHANLGVCAPPNPGEEGCISPVEELTWGSIKAMYR
jgi:hypothetical protein